MAQRYRVTLIEGDGIGPEVARATIEVLDAAGVPIDWEPALVGEKARIETGELLPQATLESIRRNKVALKAPITTPVGEGFPSINVAIRQRLDLYACLRPVRTIPGVPARFDGVDLVIVRENTEDLYAGKEHEVVPGVIESLKIITERASTRIAEFAFKYARDNKRKKVTAVHKANIMKLSDGLFLSCSRKIAEQHPEVAYNELIVDNACLKLVVDPHQFDIILTSNLYGDIISDLCAGLVGGVGVVPGANIGDEYAVFEAVHGSWPEGAGKNLANPTAMILTAVMMLRHLGEHVAADRVESAIRSVFLKGKIKTPDLGGSANTTEFAAEVARNL
ncbi:MAG: isocitrate dehydrogenase (NAD(+)) [Chloroflexi bacterium]|nr:isocitrate dehydrogenase (NAD(+)) [Chloroflexota bacterium]